MIFLPMAALFFDLLSLIPFLNVIVAPIAWITVTLWLYLEGVSPLSGRRLATIGVSFIVGLIPILSMLPEITLAVVAIILMVKLEDRVTKAVPGLGAVSGKLIK